MSHHSLPNILVIDADEPSLAILHNALNAKDYCVHFATTPADAHKAAIAFPIDLIICDEVVNGLNGIDIVSSVHSLPDRHDIPVLFASHGQGPDIIRRNYEFGGAYKIKKPYDSKLLIDLVERSLWMPALVQTHIARPHFRIGPGVATNNSQIVTGTVPARASDYLAGAND